jgi:hypothetical protein
MTSLVDGQPSVAGSSCPGNALAVMGRWLDQAGYLLASFGKGSGVSRGAKDCPLQSGSIREKVKIITF